jgi:histidinol-phosphate aminotransferase
MTWFNSLSVRAAVAAYEDRAFIFQSKQKNDAVRTDLIKEINGMNFTCAPSEANFLWVKFDEKLSDLGDKMRSYNILLQNPSRNWGRVTIGTSNEMKLFVQALKEIVGKNI